VKIEQQDIFAVLMNINIRKNQNLFLNHRCILNYPGYILKNTEEEKNQIKGASIFLKKSTNFYLGDQHLPESCI